MRCGPWAAAQGMPSLVSRWAMEKNPKPAMYSAKTAPHDPGGHRVRDQTEQSLAVGGFRRIRMGPCVDEHFECRRGPVATVGELGACES
jgi:hypothetical protein